MFVHLKTYYSNPDAQLELLRLQQAGIPSMLRHETIQSIFPVQALAMQIWVEEADRLRALELLDQNDAPTETEEIPDYRDISTREINFLRSQQWRKRASPRIWIFLIVMIILLLLAGW